MNTRKIGLIALFSVLMLCITTAPAMAADFWVSDPAVVSGLDGIGERSTPTVFNKDGTWYLIAGEYKGVFNGYKWTGSAWESDPAIVSGLGDVGGYSTPATFYKDGTWYLISGESDHVFNGYNWTGSTWQSDPAIVSGLGSIQYQYSAPTVFDKDGLWYLIAGDMNGHFHGYNWTGSAWQSDSAIVSGLDLSATQAQVKPTVFCKDGMWYLISGHREGVFYGFNWTGSAWQSDPAIVPGLGDIGFGSAPTVFYKDKRYLISGDLYYGDISGYHQRYYGISVTIAEKFQRVLPGGNTASTVRVINTGDFNASYEVTIAGTAVDEPTISVSPLTWNTGNLTSGSEHVTLVNISTTDDTPRQTYTLTVSATCDQKPTVTDSDTSELEVALTTVPDFVVGNMIGKVELFASTDDGFSSRGILKDIGDRAWGLTSGDYNSDGYQDFIVGDHDGELELFLGPGFTSRIIASVGDKAYGLTSGDYDNNGSIDFIVGDRNGELELFLNDGTSGFNSGGTIADIGLHAWTITSDDFDGDHDVDFIAGNYDGILKLFKNDGTGNFSSSIIDDISTMVYGITSGDYDGDGDCDFFASGLLFENDGTGNFARCGGFGASGHELESNDFDGDGDVDILASSALTDKVNLYKNDGTEKFTFDSVVADPGTQPWGLTSGNFVMPDLIVTSITTPIIHAGVSNIITATIKNTGNEDVTELKTTLYAGGDAIDTQLLPLLNASDSTEVSFSWTPEDAGSYTLRVMADPFNMIAEFNESNNDMTKAVTAAEAVLPPVPYFDHGWVFYENGSECNGSLVNVINLDIGKGWQANTSDNYNYYDLVLDSSDLSANDVLEFNATDPAATQKNVTHHTVTSNEVNDGGLFGFNLTLHPAVVAIEAGVRIEPETLNLGSQGVFTAYITLPEDYDVKDIDVENTVECEGAPVKDWNFASAGGGTLVAKFDRVNLSADLPTGDAVRMIVTGELFNGEAFAGYDTVTVIPDTEYPYTAAYYNTSKKFQIDTNITVHVKDDGFGVDIGTIVMTVNGTEVTPVITGDKYDYTLVYDPPTDFSCGQTVYVTIDAADLARPRNVMPTDTYSFTTEAAPK